MPTERKIRVGIAALLAIAAIGSIGAFRSPRPASASPARVAALVEVPYTGKVAKFLVRDGDLVSAGQTLAELDVSQYTEQVKKDETELAQLQTNAQQAIQPMDALPGMSGVLPRALPRTETIRVPVPDKPVDTKVAVVKPEAPKSVPSDPVKRATEERAKNEASLHKAGEALTKATAALADAQKARDALRPKFTQAQTDAVQAARKADSAQDLLDAGVISEKRRDEMLADKDTTAKAVDAITAQIAEADRVLEAAKKDLADANKAVESATAALKSSDELLAKAASETPQVAAPAKAAPVSPTKPAVHYETKVVTKRMPMVVREEAAPALPLKVFVDEKAMKATITRAPDLKAEIDSLQKKIGANKVIAPVSGRVHIVDGKITIQP